MLRKYGIVAVVCFLVSWCVVACQCEPVSPGQEQGVESTSEPQVKSEVSESEKRLPDGGETRETPSTDSPSVEKVATNDTLPDARMAGDVLTVPVQGGLGAVSAMLPLADGGLALLLYARGEATLGSIVIKPPAGRHLYLLVLKQDGTPRLAKRLISSDKNNPGDRYQMHQLGDTLAISTLGRKAVIDPEGHKIQMPDANQPGEEWSHFVFQFSLVSGQIDPKYVRVFGEVTALGGDSNRWYIGGNCQAEELKATANGSSVTRKVKKRNTGSIFGGNAFVLRMDAASSIKQVWMLDGPASSSVGSIIATSDGVYLSGGLGGFGDGLDGIFDEGLPTEKILTCESADDDPAWDVYVARLDLSMKLKWARLIQAYQNGQLRGKKMVRWGDGVAIHVNKSGYDMLISKGEPDQRKEKEPGVIAYAGDGALKGYVRVSQALSLRVIGDSLLVQGASNGDVVFGPNQTTLPDTQSLGAERKVTRLYVLAYDASLKLVGARLGAWMLQGAKDEAYSFLVASIHSSNSLWLAKSFFGQVIVEKGGKQPMTFGEDGKSMLSIFRWPLRYTAP